MDYETAVRKLDEHEPFAFCVALLGLPAGANQWGHELLAPERLAEAKALPATFEVVEAGEQSWLVHDDQVVIRPAPLWHRFDRGGGHVEAGFLPTNDLPDALEIAYQTQKMHLVATRETGGWKVALGARTGRGATLEDALRVLVPKARLHEGTADA